MAAYLETEELFVGVKYNCETYDGVSCILEYTGEGMFNENMSIEGVVRYVFGEADMTIVELIAEMKNHRDYRDCADDTTWNRLIPIMLNVLELAIVWHNSDDVDNDHILLSAAIEQLAD